MSSNQQLNVVQVLDSDGTNWPLWRVKMRLIFESKGLLPHIEGTAKKPTISAAILALARPSKDQIEEVEKYEEKLNKYNSREGRAKAQVIISVSESMGLILEKYPTAKEMWNALVTEIMKKPKMVTTTLQRQLHNIRCSEEDDLCEHLDKAQDLQARLKEMGGAFTEGEFMDIILSSLPPSYETVMDALTTSLEGYKQPIKPEIVIRLLKAQYNK
jgi:hypothetical protein